MTQLQAYYNQIKDCHRCRLYKGRTNFVFGEGNETAEIMFVGEAPGKEEDIQGRPFVGQAGQILNRLLNSIDLKREDVYISNIVKSRPPNNRDPLPDEIETCKPYLMEQIKLINPKIIATLGAHSSRTLLNKNISMAEAHGKEFKVNDYLIFPIYHPAATLYNPKVLDFLENDFKNLKSALERLKNH